MSDSVTITNPVDFMNKSFMEYIMGKIGYKKEKYTLNIIKKYEMTQEITIKFQNIMENFLMIPQHYN